MGAQESLSVKSPSEKSSTWETVSRGFMLVGITACSVPVAGLFMLATGTNPVEAYAAMITGALGSTRGLTEIALMATPLLLIGLGLVLAFRCKLWNIGTEGQYLAGATCSTWVGLMWGDTLPPVAIIPIMILAGLVGGALWAAIPALMKVKLGLSEVVVSIMLNYVAYHGLAYLVRRPLKDPDWYLYETARLPEAAQMPMLGDTRLHIGVIVALVCVPLIYFLIRSTSFGYDIRAVGANPKAAEAAGINISRSVIIVFLMSGALSGLAGTFYVSGVQLNLSLGSSAGYGYSAILIAILGGLNAFQTLFSSYLFALLAIGADYMARVVHVHQSIVTVVQSAMVIFFMVGKALVQRRS